MNRAPLRVSRPCRASIPHASAPWRALRAPLANGGLSAGLLGSRDFRARKFGGCGEGGGVTRSARRFAPSPCRYSWSGCPAAWLVRSRAAALPSAPVRCSPAAALRVRPVVAPLTAPVLQAPCPRRQVDGANLKGRRALRWTLQGDLRPPRPWGLFRPQTRPGSWFRCLSVARKSTLCSIKKGCFFIAKGLTVNP